MDLEIEGKIQNHKAEVGDFNRDCHRQVHMNLQSLEEALVAIKH